MNMDLELLLKNLAPVPPVTPVSAAPLITTVAAQSVVIAPANAKRKGFIIYNNSSNSMYVTFGPTSVSSACTVIIPTFNQFVSLGAIAYQGPISGIRNSGTGSAIVTELVGG
jgi:hypothetical protein